MEACEGVFMMTLPAGMGSACSRLDEPLKYRGSERAAIPADELLATSRHPSR